MYQLEIKKIETGRMVNGELVILATQYALMIGDSIITKHDTEEEAQAELTWRNDPVQF